MNVYAYMVTKNEADRYLKQAVDSIRPHVDGLFVYDDRSKDATTELLTEWKVPHIVRRMGDPAFLDNEDLFRQDAWDRMESMFAPRLGDWIVALDADEQLRTAHDLRDIARLEDVEGRDGVRMRVHEMWAEGQRRVDGWWAEIEAKRFCRWEPNGLFRHKIVEGEYVPKEMGGGSVPNYVLHTHFIRSADILHFGYFNERERYEKVERYMKGPVSGHNPDHIRSITSTPTLAPLPRMV